MANLFRVILAAISLTGGIVVAGILYASAGYGLATEGVMAQVSTVIATIFAATAGILTAAAWCRAEQNRLVATIFFFSAATGLIGLELTARARADEWAQTWSYERPRLMRLATALAAGYNVAGHEQRIYVAVEDGPKLAQPAAAAPWEISGAAAWAYYKTTADRSLTADLWTRASTMPKWFAATKDWFSRWDGSKLQQGFCTSSTVIYSGRGRELWIWDTSTSVVSKAETPWERGCH